MMEVQLDKIIKRITFELSEKCNAACPLCLRTNRYENSKPIEGVNLKRELLIKDFKHIITPKVLDTVEQINLCGNVGDPIASRDCLKIVEYLSKFNVKIDLETNGGLRNEKWWSTLGSYMNKKDSIVYFHIDGLEDTNHLYRQKTNYNTIIRNAKAFINAGGRAVWEFIPFAHNEHQIEEAQRISEEIGFMYFQLRKSNRGWAKGVDKIKYVDPKGTERYLRPPSEKNIGGGVKRKEISEDQEISCRYLNGRSTYVNCDGTLWPCCYLAADIYKMHQNNIVSASETVLIEKMNPVVNLLEEDPGAILSLAFNNNFFNDIQAEWPINGPMTCQNTCGKNINGSDRIKVND